MADLKTNLLGFALNSPALLAVFCQLKGLREPST